MKQLSQFMTHHMKSSTAWLLLTCLMAVGCNSDIEPSSTSGTSGTDTSGGTSGGTGGNTGGGTDSGNSDGDVGNGQYSLTLSNNNLNLNEGSAISVDIQVQRSNGYAGKVSLALAGASPADLDKIGWQFSDSEIESDETNTRLTLNLDYGPLPAQRDSRTLRIVGTDGRNQSVAVLNIQTVPTSLPDVYLLIGQSNMVGASEFNAKQAAPGQPDAPVNNVIMQLNVTGNDGQNFDSIAAFKSESNIAVGMQLFTPALDPLHEGFDSSINGKEGTRIGMGLSFAKRAISDTQAPQIILVPAAWSNTGFCQVEDRALFPGMLGWNATTPSNPALSGTLLHDRAIARTDLALRESGGILRGILWHQGETDSNNAACAQSYAQNLAEMVRSLRSKIRPDARGTQARGPNANIPFVVGSMSRGGDYVDFSDTKTLVHEAHVNISQIVPFSAFVTNDDLIPPDYPCGDGDCIHFGSTSLRLMGSRYYDFLIQAATQ